MKTMNIFTHYKQLEDHFTNGFVSILSLSQIYAPEFVASFLRDVPGLAPAEHVDTFRVLPRDDGTADGELYNEPQKLDQ